LDLAPPNEKLGVALGAVDVVSAGLGANDNAAGVVLFSAGLLADERKPN
jgi:Zn-dependent M28 family amino/carboxypeptidase